MKKKIIKQNLRFYSKFLLLIGALIAFVCSFGVSSYAWSTDSNGNLVSDNLLDEEVAKFDTWTIKLGTANLQANVTYNLWSEVSFPEGQRAVLKDNNNNIIAFSGWTFSGDNHFTLNSSYSGLLYLSGTFTTVQPAKFMLNVGSTALPYEPYGVTYYSKSNMDKITHVNFGAFAFCDSIKVRYYNSNDLLWHDYKSFNNVYEFVNEKYVTFRNQSLIIDDFKLIFVELGGISDWRYQIYVHFPSNAIRVENYNVWAFTSANNVDLDTYAGTGYHGTNVGNLSLTGEGFSKSDYLKYIYYTRINPNIATPTGSFGTPNSSVQYNQGYNDGYEIGKDDGFSSGFDDGKKEGIDIGYNDGYRDGEESDFTTNGFKTLIGSIFNYPINMIKSIFNFEFMGINIYSIIVFIMSIGIVIFVIRRFKK